MQSFAMIGKNIHFLFAICFFLLSFGLTKASGDLKNIARTKITTISPTNAYIEINFNIPQSYYLYPESVNLNLVEENYPIQKIKEGPFVQEKDPVSGEDKMFFTGMASLIFEISFPEIPKKLMLALSYQGCKENICFFPEKVFFLFDNLALNSTIEGTLISSKETTNDDINKPTAQEYDQIDELKQLLNKFNVTSSYYGYMDAEDFISFLDGKLSGFASDTAVKTSLLKKISLLIFIFLGGLALNLTPCVLPMIPINLAIIGAGARALSRKQGALLGGIFGAGIAFAYGMLGIIVVVAGGTFGAINASATFNFIIAIVFIIMALAMMGIIPIDLSRWQAGVKMKSMGLVAIFTTGVISAILAGACVAPAVISTLVLAANLYAEGHLYSLILPFLLGFGMALPWPIVGAGIKLLPKPGRWMEIIKYAFSILIMLVALYYLYTAYTLSPLYVKRSSNQSYQAEVWETNIVTALNTALQSNKPIFIDFWASWCKSCKMMEKTTFIHPQVKAKLENFIKLKIQAEKPSEKHTKKILELFNVRGLPTYLILTPKNPR